jgi:membrane protein DedA with SNARE-associated domain
MAIESANIPLPSEIIMPFTGYMVSIGKFSFWPAVFSGAIGGTIGSLLSFALGYYGGESLIRKLIRKYGKYVLVFEYELDEAMHWFKKYGQFVTFTARLFPVVRTFISLPAGMSRMDPKKFTLFAFLGSLIWCIPLTFIGMQMGAHWQSIGGYFRKFDYLIAILFVGLGIFYIYHKITKHKAWQKKHSK